MRAKLDKRPARPDCLTTRECAKLFCGMINAISSRISIDDIRIVLTYLVETNVLWKKQQPPSRQHLIEMAKARKKALTTEGSRAAELVLGGLTGSLADIVKQRNIRKTLEWCLARLDQIYQPPLKLMGLDDVMVEDVLAEMDKDCDSQ